MGGLVTYCVTFTGTYIAYAGAYAGIAFVYDRLLLFNHGWILWLSGSEVEWSFTKMRGAFGCQCFANEHFVNFEFYHMWGTRNV